MYKNSIIWSAEMRGGEKGIKEGIKKGEKKKQIEIARNLLKQNVDIDIIIVFTGLSKEEIRELIKN